MGVTGANFHKHPKVIRTVVRYANDRVDQASRFERATKHESA